MEERTTEKQKLSHKPNAKYYPILLFCPKLGTA